jgi:hypothetical protein
MTHEQRFTSPEAYAAAIVAEADHFVVHRYSAAGHDSMTAKTFAEASRIAQAVLLAGCRVLIYAVTTSGRSGLAAARQLGSLRRACPTSSRRIGARASAIEESCRHCGHHFEAAFDPSR